MYTISIIVPVYNSEKYLTQCLESICNQTYKPLEVILIDDGSTDQSGQICDAFAEKDERIQVYHGINVGAFEARNIGIGMAKGDYITFMDSDDWIESDMIESIVSEINPDADLIAYGFTSESAGPIWLDEEGFISSRDDYLEICKNAMYDELKGYPGVFQSIWTKLFKRELLQNHIESIQGINMRITLGDDAFLLYTYIWEKAATLQKMHNTGYHYMNREDSMCTKRDANKFLDIVNFYDEMGKRISMYPAEWEAERQLKYYVIILIQLSQKNLFSILQRTFYFLPDVQLGNRVILYGAGNVGKDYYEQLKGKSDLKIVEWVDKFADNSSYKECSIVNLEKASFDSYDTVLIAVFDETKVSEIRKDLRQHGVLEDRIVWRKPMVHSDVFRYII